jgi:hypothetical protein
MWQFEITSGNLTEPDGTLAGTGYSGHGEGVDNPADEQIPDVGPIPEGQYTIGTFFDDPGGKGPVVCHLYPMPGTDTLGRSGMMIHGDNSEHNQTASHGCIILARPLREAIRDSGDTLLQVTS